jgi:MoaA/NifB/PqqE/SkfB family radical SAM enzyme
LLTEPLAEPRSLGRLPLITLYLTERCNSRCITCDYWKNGRRDVSRDAVRQLLPDLAALGTRLALISGGEPLLNPQWPDIARLLRDSGLKLWLLTSGLALAKHSVQVAQLFSAVTVSLDGTDRATYATIRGLDAFDKVCEGIEAAAGAGMGVSIRVTVQRANYRQLRTFIELAHRLGARQISFLAVDVANPHAFARTDDFSKDLALAGEDLPVLEAVLGEVEREHAADFASGFIAESPQKLWRLRQYFAAVLGLAAYPPVRCNAPEFSAVVGATGAVQPCFFIEGAPAASVGRGLTDVLNGSSMRALRQDIREGRRAECARCVCSMWRDPETFADLALLPAGLVTA